MAKMDFIGYRNTCLNENCTAFINFSLSLNKSNPTDGLVKSVDIIMCLNKLLRNKLIAVTERGCYTNSLWF